MKRKTLGTMISEIRKEQGMTQMDLARQMGVTDKAVSKWERDLSCPDVDSLPRLAELLNVSVDELMQSRAEPPKSLEINAVISLILKSAAMAMGIAVVVLSVMDALEAGTGVQLLGIGLTCIALDAVRAKG